MESKAHKTIELDQFLKRVAAVGSGGAAKFVIQAGEVMVNDAVETRRGRKLQPGDIVEYEGHKFTVPQPVEPT